MENKKLTQVISDLCKKDAAEFRKIIINMSFSPSTFFEMNGFNPEEVEKLLPKWKFVRKTLRNEYSSSHPLFNMGTTAINFFPADMRSASESDVYLMEYISDVVENYIEDPYNNVKRVVYLLSTDAENTQFGGLRELGFKYFQAKKLITMPGMLSALVNWINLRNEPEEDIKPKYIDCIDQQIAEIKQEVEETLESEQEVQPTSSTLFNLVLSNKAEVENFFKAVSLMKTANFSLDDIKKLIDIGEEKSLSLIKANEDFMSLL